MPRNRKFHSKFGFCLAGILYIGSSERKESVVIGESGRIMSNPLKSLRNLGRKSRQPSNPIRGEVIVWYVPKIRLR